MVNKRVMIVDDESDVNLAIKMVLEDSGFQVDSFTDPLLAFESVKGEPGKYMLLVLDIRMPNMNGFELCQQIKKIDDKVKVCFLTAGEMDYAQFRKELSPALDENCYIQKPIQNEILIKRLKRIIGAK
jgi:DNA-binding response OmpR family regulator